MPVAYEELEHSYHYVSSSFEEYNAYVDHETGRIYWEMDDQIEELPDDLGDDTRYFCVPNQHDLDLGKPLVMAFTRANMPSDIDAVDRMFRARGAYGRYKNLLQQRGQLDAWHAYEQAAIQSALTEWCRGNGLELVFDPAETAQADD